MEKIQILLRPVLKIAVMFPQKFLMVGGWNRKEPAGAAGEQDEGGAVGGAVGGSEKGAIGTVSLLAIIIRGSLDV